MLVKGATGDQEMIECGNPRVVLLFISMPVWYCYQLIINKPRKEYVKNMITDWGDTGRSKFPWEDLLTISRVVMLGHYNDVIMGAVASQITSLTIVYSTVHSGADHRKHESSASLAFERGSHRWPVNLMTSSCAIEITRGLLCEVMLLLSM